MSRRNSLHRQSAQLLWRLAGGLVERLLRVLHSLLHAARSEQLLLPADGASPGIVSEAWGQPFAQKTFSGDPAHSMALAIDTNHVRSLRKIVRGKLKLYTLSFGHVLEAMRFRRAGGLEGNHRLAFRLSQVRVIPFNICGEQRAASCAIQS